ncbi:MAG: AmmeMemoRadiSam system protein B [bacterium]|nr:AmmeMemoRadiSam system protein B [bacterium]
MKPHIIIIVILVCILPVCGLIARDVRPVRDDIGYCWDSRQLERFMDYLESTASTASTASTDSADLPTLVAGISPHDDYLYAGRIYYPLYKKITAPEVVVFGVTHGTVRKKLGDPHNKVIFETYSHWKGPYKDIEVSGLREYLKKNLPAEMVMVSNEAHRLEHSIEGMLPFLQHVSRDVKITPIMITGMPFEKMDALSKKLASTLAVYIKEKGLKLGKDIFFLVSADANHYGPDFDNTVFGEGVKAHEKGTKLDKDITGTLLSGPVVSSNIKRLTRLLWGNDFKGYGDTLWCGKYSVPFGLLTVNHLVKKLFSKKQLTGNVLLYSDTYSEGVVPLKKPGFGITAPFSLKHWVGFFSAGYYLKLPPAAKGLF